MEELYNVMDDLLDPEFQIKAGMDILKELEELYASNPEKEETEAEKLAVLMKGYLQSIKANLREILLPGYKGWTEIKKYGKICIRNDVVKSKYTLELLVLANPLVLRIYALLFDVN